MLHAVVIALAAGVRSVRIGVGPRLVEIVYMEVERHDPVGAIAQLEKLAKEVRSWGAGIASLRGVDSTSTLFGGSTGFSPAPAQGGRRTVKLRIRAIAINARCLMRVASIESLAPDRKE